MFCVLILDGVRLIDFARVVFAFLYRPSEIELFLRDSLKLDMPSEDAKKYITNKIQSAPKQWKTKMKNLMHGFAQKMKSHPAKSPGAVGNGSLRIANSSPFLTDL